MIADDPSISSTLVSIDSVLPFPGNPRRGDVELIAESLKAFGQYRPIVVRRSDNTILAGNHTWQAAKSLGWRDISAVYIDADDDRARRIVLADNRTSDLSWVDEEALGALLNTLPDIEHTGYDDRTLDRLLSKQEHAEKFEEELEVINGHERVNCFDATAVITFGAKTYFLGHEEFQKWRDATDFTPEDFVAATRWPLMLEEEQPEKPEAPAEPVNHERRMGPVQLDAGEQVLVEGLLPVIEGVRHHAGNAVQESLRVNGQYRPIVINRRDNRVVVGYAVVEAARKLDLTTLQAVFVDVDPQDAVKMSLMDNRTSELAWYDDDQLASLLLEIHGTNGTGFSDRDRRKIIGEVGSVGEADTAPPPVYMKVRHATGEIFWTFPAKRSDFDNWYEAVQREARYSEEGIKTVLAGRMQIDLADLKSSQRR